METWRSVVAMGLVAGCGAPAAKPVVLAPSLAPAPTEQRVAESKPPSSNAQCDGSECRPDDMTPGNWSSDYVSMYGGTYGEEEQVFGS